jgi:catalase
MLLNIDKGLAQTVATDLGMERLPEPLPLAINPPKPEIEVSPALSLMARPGDGSIATRKIAILVADGIDDAAAIAIHDGLNAEGALPFYVGTKYGTVNGGAIEVEITTEIMPSVLFDAVVVPGGEAAAEKFAYHGEVKEFIMNAYRHCKPLLIIGAGARVLEKVGISQTLVTGEKDTGLIMVDAGKAQSALSAFIKAIARHRHFERDVEPYPV